MSREAEVEEGLTATDRTHTSGGGDRNQMTNGQRKKNLIKALIMALMMA